MVTVRLLVSASFVVVVSLATFGCSGGTGDSARDAASVVDGGKAGAQEAAARDVAARDTAARDAAGRDSAPPDAVAADSTARDGGARDTAGGPDASSGSHDSGIDGAVSLDGSGTGGLRVTIQFDGDQGKGLSGCSGSPPKCRQLPELNVAANGTQVAQITVQDLTVFDYSGHLLGKTPLPTFVTNAGLNPNNAGTGFPYEPHVFFNEFINRWMVTTTCLYDCFLVSASSDATGSWQGIYVAKDGSDPGMHLGYDINGAYISEFASTGHDSNTANFSYSFFAIPKAELQWTTTFAPTHLNPILNTPLDGMPIIDHNANKQITDPAFFVAKSCPSGSCQNASNFSFDWLVNKVTWSGTTATYGPDQLIKTNVGSTQNQWLYNTPLNSAQLGSTTPIHTAESHRLLDTVQFGTHIHGVLPSGPCTAGCGAAQGIDTQDLLFWVDLDCTTPSACHVSQTAKISSATEHYVFPSVGVDVNGNVGITTAALSPSIYPSIRAFWHLATGPANAISGPTTVINGTKPYTCINDPINFDTAVGLTTVRDPVDGTKLWTTQQYGESGTACVWNTRILQYQIQ